MKPVTRRIACVFVLVAATTCACAQPESGTPESSVTTETSVVLPPSAPVEPAQESGPAEQIPAEQIPAERITVPIVIGMDHQHAQDTMQAAGLYNLREHDGSGEGRMLVWDRNWETISQDPPAGTTVSPDTVITLTAVKKTD